MIKNLEIKKKLWDLFAPIAASQSIELIDIEVNLGQASSIRIFLDHPQGITLDQCVECSRLFSRILDVEDPIAQKYRLEVSSPGPNRPLSTMTHFGRHIGDLVQFKLLQMQNSKPQKLKAKIQAIKDEHTLEVMNLKNEIQMIRLEQIYSAHLISDKQTQLLQHQSKES